MKKLVSLLLVIAMLASLAACGGNTAVEEKPTDAAVEATDAAGEVTPEAPEEINYYGFDEPVNIKIGVSYAAASDFTFYGGETVEDNAWMDLYHANNIFPEIMWDVDPSQAETKLSTAIMSGDYPDVFQGTGAEYANYVESGAVADITEVFEKYASPELKEYMEFDGGMALGALYVDGRLYGLPKVTDPQTGIDVMWIRMDWLENLGLEVPKTMEELKAVAYAFTHNDPDGNGKDDTYGIAFDGVDVLTTSVGNMESFFNAFGVYLDDDGLTYVENEDGTIRWGGDNAEGMKQALQMLRDMYAEGSIAKDFVTMNGSSIFAETGAGNCGIWFGPNWGAMEPAVNATKNDPNAHVVAAPVPTGTGEVTKGYAAATPSKVFFVSSQCEHPEVFIKLWNLAVKYQNTKFCTAEEYNMYYGDSANYSGWKTCIIEGGMQTGRTTNKALVAALEAGDGSGLDAKQTENYTSMKTYIDAVADGTFDPNDSAHARGLSLYTVHAGPMSAWVVLHEMLANDSYVLAAYNGIPSEEVSNATGTLEKLLIETIIKIITGADEVDSYDDFLKTWYAMGGQTAIDEANAAK